MSSGFVVSFDFTSFLLPGHTIDSNVCEFSSPKYPSAMLLVSHFSVFSIVELNFSTSFSSLPLLPALLTISTSLIDNLPRCYKRY